MTCVDASTGNMTRASGSGSWYAGTGSGYGPNDGLLRRNTTAADFSG